MADANHKKFGPGQQDQGKGDGSGGMSPADVEPLPDREILSNRDSARHSDQRGLDGRHVQNENLHEQSGNHAPAAGDAGRAGAVSRPPLADERPGNDGQDSDGQDGEDPSGQRR